MIKSLLISILCVFGLSVSAQTFDFVRQIPAGESERLQDPVSMAMDSRGHVYVADQSVNKIVEYDADGIELKVHNSLGEGDNTLAVEKPRHIFIDDNDNLYVFDDGRKKVLVRYADGKTFEFGEKGSGIAQMSSIAGLVVDDQGYICLLNKGRKQLDIYQPDGVFRTYISGGFTPFEDPVSLGINGANELCVLDAKSPSIVMIDIHGNQVNMHREFDQWEEVNAKEAVALTAMKNGDLFLVDEKACAITQLSRPGEVLANHGGKNEGVRGRLDKPFRLASREGDRSLLAVLDAGTGKIQVFAVVGQRAPMRPADRRMKVIDGRTSRQPLVDLEVSPSGDRYAIPESNREVILVFNDTTNQEKSAIQNTFKSLVDLEIDPAGQVYALDNQNKEVFVFDKDGVLVRRFGKDAPKKLKDPTSLVLQSTGNVVVADKGSGNIHLWNNQGVYQKVITSADNSVLRSPRKLQVDSKDQIYIWDDKNNCIYRTSSTGWPIAMQVLKARPLRVGDEPGTIAGFFVDHLDQIFILNTTTSQIEMYQWDVQPELHFTVGHPGKSTNGLSGMGSMVFDKLAYLVYCNGKTQADQKMIQLLVKPPAPAPELDFRIADNKLQVRFETVSSPLVVGYGLLSDANDEGEKKLVIESNFNSLTVDESDVAQLEPRYYELVSLSKNDYSDPAGGFYNYLNLGDRYKANGVYEEAFSAYEKAIQVFGKEGGIGTYIATQLMDVATLLTNNSEVGRAIPYLREAYLLDHTSKSLKLSAESILQVFISQLASNGEVATVLTEAEKLMRIPGFKPVIGSAMNAVCQDLGQVNNERILGYSIVMGKYLVEKDPENPFYAKTLGAASYRLFEMKSLSGVPSLELEAILSEAILYSRRSVTQLKNTGQDYTEADLLLMNALNASGSFNEVEANSLKELTENISDLSVAEAVAYRSALAAAYMGEKKFDQAALEYRRINELTPGDYDVQDKLGQALISNQQYAEAREVYQKLALQHADKAYISGQLGRIEGLSGNYAEASFQIEKALQQDPTLRDLYGPLASAYEGASNSKLALENYKVALDYQNELIQRAERKVSSFEYLSGLKKERENYLFKIAKLHDALGQSYSAIGAYQQIIAGNSELAEAHFGLGQSALNGGLVYDAINSFSRACQLEPTNQLYKKEFDNAMKVRDKLARQEAALSILDVHTQEIYPSLYLNYADASQLPVGRVVIANNTDIPITPTSVSVMVQGLMDNPTEVKPPAMVGYSNTYLNLSAIFDKRILDITEDKTMQMEVVVKYNQDGKSKKASLTSAFIVHGRNSIIWSDKRRMAAFVSPADQHLIDYSRDLVRMFADRPSYRLNRNLLAAAQLYTFLHRGGYQYSPDPVQSYAFVSTHTETMDFLQYPAETILRKSGDCDDLVALYAALLESSGIETAYIDVPGHVFLALNIELSPDQVQDAGLELGDVIEKGGEVWVPVETTFIGKHGFMAAWREGVKRYRQELEAGHFPEIVSMRDARKVYRASSFTPEKFEGNVLVSAKTLEAYDLQVTELLAKVNAQTLENLENRYQTEVDNIYVKNQYAALLAQIGQEEKANAILLEALDRSPGNPVILNNLGNVNLLINNAQEAIKYYLLASELDDKDGEILINLCKAYLLAGDKENAKKAFDKAVSLDAELNYLYDELKTDLQ